MVKNLQGLSAIVTGGSRGIGAGIALELASRGANVLITYQSASQQAEEVAAQIKGLGCEALIVQAAGNDKEAPSRIVKAAVEKWSHIDIIVNNAGAGDDCLLKDMTYELWDKVLNTNVRMATFLVMECMPYLGKAPRIVNISSVMARMGGAYATAYCASKAALEGVTKVWAAELGQSHNATVNCVNPGPVGTDMWLRDTGADVLAEWDIKMKETPAAPRIGTVDDVAQIVAFLASEEVDGAQGAQSMLMGACAF
ncbi:3-oxoacyl-[acyl-carrier-protein] reductase [Lachnellula subtilissima]|uniref:3-oxoacyl-[acyl-carrier-protein] reductase n=1 Tax=Lachnellula subtilissima TaxID=602034 RepID=A0A8H8RR93_9HELO|nr:3-oxoacyl-[acyl-carrier-protein] reductase [Lachnellula subtilissima]